MFNIDTPYGKSALISVLKHLGHACRIEKAHRMAPPVPEPVLSAPERLKLMNRKLEELGFS